MSASPTKTYRVYCFDGVHKALTHDLIEAASDDDAIAKANAMGFGTRCELWEANRLVAELESRAA